MSRKLADVWTSISTTAICYRRSMRRSFFIAYAGNTKLVHHLQEGLTNSGLRISSEVSKRRGQQMSGKRSTWKIERASVHRGGSRAKSNKYTKNDADDRPAPHTRSKVWIGSYTRADGRKVEGHFRYLMPKSKASSVSKRG